MIPCLYLFVFLAFFSSTNANQNIYVNVTTLPLWKEESYLVHNKLEYVIEIINLTDSIRKNPPRVLVSCESCEEDSPVLVVIRQRKGVLSWELPLGSFIDGDTELYRSTARTLCPDDIEPPSKDFENELTVSLSSVSATPVNVQLQVRLENDFVLSMGSPMNVSLTASTPRFFLYEFPPKEAENNVDAVLMKVDSEDATCMSVSVQHIHCPVYDLERNLQFDGYFQSMTKSSGITISRNSFPRGFYAVFVVHSSDKECNKGQLLTSNLSKNIIIEVVPTITIMDYITAVSVAGGTLVLVCFLMALLAYFYIRNLTTMYEDVPGPMLPASSSTDARSASLSPPWNGSKADTLSLQTDSSLDETDMDLLADIENDKELRRLKPVLYLCDLSTKKPIVLAKKSQLYLWYLLTVGLFYFLPVVQLVITYQKVVNTTGNQNLCYYNFLCAHPLLLLSDFNHVISNSGYVFLGVVFIFITFLRQRRHEAAVFLNKTIDKAYGIPRHFGLFYAMGAALIVEGILSACYHVCPNNYNFQFDTSFMYVISTMCMLKIYHSRHPDVSASAWATFGVLAMAILAGMCGVLKGDPLFWSLFTVLHVLTCFRLSLQIYYLGRWKHQMFRPIRIIKEIYVNVRLLNLSVLLPTYKLRFVTILAANAVNWMLAGFGLGLLEGNFATYLLAVFMVNLMLYTTFYIVMKIYCGEQIRLAPSIYILVSCAFWGASLYFFFHNVTSWKTTPAESRSYNQPCRILNFYDNHDIWHFLSAFSMFFSFMVLLTLDDDLVNVPRDRIAVF